MQLWMLKYCYNVASILTLLINQCLQLLFHFDFRDTMAFKNKKWAEYPIFVDKDSKSDESEENEDFCMKTTEN